MSAIHAPPGRLPAGESGGATLWYSIADMLPPVGVVVWVRWTGARPPFLAARVAHPETRRRAWAVETGGRPILLPCTTAAPPDPRRPWDGWHTLKGDDPEHWRPQKPEAWRMPLPAPALVVPDTPAPGRLWSATMRFAAVEEAEAADLAAEMEHMRETARAGGSGASGRLPAGESDAPTQQWWLDPTAVTYSPPGAVSEREAEGRLMRAFLAERWESFDHPQDRTFGDVLDGLAKTLPGDTTDDLPPPRIEPSGRDKDDMLVALAWLKAFDAGGELGWRGEMVLRLRGVTPPMSWRSIGKKVNRAHEGARQLYARALAEVTAEANGRPTAGGDLARARLERVRAANRAAKIL